MPGGTCHVGCARVLVSFGVSFNAALEGWTRGLFFCGGIVLGAGSREESAPGDLNLALSTEARLASLFTFWILLIYFPFPRNSIRFQVRVH